jgi:hypothetical protein
MIFALIIGCAIDANGVVQEGAGSCIGFASRGFATEEECVTSATTEGVNFVMRQGFIPVTFRCVPIGDPA